MNFYLLHYHILLAVYTSYWHYLLEPLKNRSLRQDFLRLVIQTLASLTTSTDLSLRFALKLAVFIFESLSVIITRREPVYLQLKIYLCEWESWLLVKALASGSQWQFRLWIQAYRCPINWVPLNESIACGLDYLDSPCLLLECTYLRSPFSAFFLFASFQYLNSWHTSKRKAVYFKQQFIFPFQPFSFVLKYCQGICQVSTIQTECDCFPWPNLSILSDLSCSSSQQSSARYFSTNFSFVANPYGNQ